jgi:hypothetical protein
MKPHRPTLDKLIREVEEARLKVVALVSRGKEVLHQARAISRSIEERVGQVTTSQRKRPDGRPDVSPNPAGAEQLVSGTSQRSLLGERPMLDYQADAGESATACRSYDRAGVSQHNVEIRQDESSNWEQYALFVFEQQGSYCQLG